MTVSLKKKKIDNNLNLRDKTNASGDPLNTSSNYNAHWQGNQQTQKKKAECKGMNQRDTSSKI
jgi:hypothetical protein